jgi:hypothetical protein
MMLRFVPLRPVLPNVSGPVDVLAAQANYILGPAAAELLQNNHGPNHWWDYRQYDVDIALRDRAHSRLFAGLGFISPQPMNTDQGAVERHIDQFLLDRPRKNAFDAADLFVDRASCQTVVKDARPSVSWG